MDLPAELQTRRKEIEQAISQLEEKRWAVWEDIVRFRINCQHKAIPETENNYTVYCQYCGDAMNRRSAV